MTGAPFRPVDCRPKTAVQFAERAAELTVTAVPNHHHWQEDDIAYNHLITAVRAEWSSTG